MSRNSANNTTAPYTSSSIEEATAALPFPATVLRNAGTLAIQLVLGEIPPGRLASADAAGDRPSYYMKVEPDRVLHCRGCRALHAALTDLQVQLAGPLAVLLGTGGEPPPALREELDRELQVLAAEHAPPGGSGWSPLALLQETIGILVRHWPVILAVAELLRVRDHVAPLDLLEVAVPALSRVGPLPPELGWLLQLCEGEARTAVSTFARRTAAIQHPSPEELQLRDELWGWETLALQVEEAELAWGPPRPVQHAALAAATRAFRLPRGVDRVPAASVPDRGDLIRATRNG